MKPSKEDVIYLMKPFDQKKMSPWMASNYLNYSHRGDTNGIVINELYGYVNLPSGLMSRLGLPKMSGNNRTSPI